MIWEDECYLLSKRKFRENANIVNIFTQKKGKLDEKKEVKKVKEVEKKSSFLFPQKISTVINMICW